MRGVRAGQATTVAMATAVLVAGCGQAPPVASEEVPVTVAEPVPFDATHLTPRPSPSPASEDGPEPSPEPTVESDDAADTAAGTPRPPANSGPSPADAAAFVASDALADLDDVEHVVVDVDGDTTDEVVATGLRDRTGQVRVAWWTDDGYEVFAADQAGPGRAISDLRVADVNQDDRVELLVEVEGEGLQSLAVWSVTGRGRLLRLEAVGGCHDGTHVFGVTTARLQQGGDGPPAIVADCDESPLPVADWSEDRWVWQGGAYRQFVPDEAVGPEDDEDGQDGQDGDGGADDGDDAD